MSDTKFAQLIASKKIDPRRILVASRLIERLTREDRSIQLAKRRAKRTEGDKAVKETRKPHSGRGVTPRAIAAALKGGAGVSGPTKTRILRAVNRLLEQKKQEPVDLKALF